MVKKIGLITYHAAYNFGSVFQTYGTVRKLKDLGFDVETINYRTPSQKLWYMKDFSKKKNPISMVYNYGFLFIPSARKRRRQKFEEFIKKYLFPTSKEYNNYTSLKEESFDYDILLSGGDQIWNPNCGEFSMEGADSILPYFLKFGDNQKKIAFSSSIGNQTIRILKQYKPYLIEFDALSTREPIGKEYLERITKKNVELVCDPTWLLKKEEWLTMDGLYSPNVSKPYIFIYVLYWNFRDLNHWMPAIKHFAKKYGLDIFCISPLNFYKDRDIRMLQDAGPLDFISYMAHAKFVITNTFHGTIIPMNLNIPFISCNVHEGSRQSQILKLCNLDERIINSPSELLEFKDLNIDFSEASRIIDSLRESSIKYLEKNLKYE